MSNDRVAVLVNNISSSHHLTAYKVSSKLSPMDVNMFSGHGQVNGRMDGPKNTDAGTPIITISPSPVGMEKKEEY